MYLVEYKTSKKTSKFNNKTSFYDGFYYQSVFEASHAAELDMLKKASLPKEKVVEWKRQYKVPLIVNGFFIANYYIDFWVEYADGHIELHETKGCETEVWRLKVKLLEATYLKDHPNETYRVIKQKTYWPNKRGRPSFSSKFK